MKFSTVVPFFVAGALAASPVGKAPTKVRRDLATITEVVGSIQSQVTALDQAVTGFSGDMESLQSASDAVLQAINDGNERIAATDSISLTDALTLQSAVEDLTGAVNTTINDLISQKDAIVAAGGGAQTLESLNQQNDAAGTLATTISSKVPEGVQELAQQLSAGITDALQRGIAAYEDQAGSGGASSSAPAGGESTPAATPTGGSSEPSSPAGEEPTPAVPSPPSYPSGAASGTTGVVPTPTYGSTPPPFTGAAMPTAQAGYGMAVMAAVAAVAAF